MQVLILIDRKQRTQRTTIDSNNEIRMASCDDFDVRQQTQSREDRIKPPQQQPAAMLSDNDDYITIIIHCIAPSEWRMYLSAAPTTRQHRNSLFILNSNHYEESEKHKLPTLNGFTRTIRFSDGTWTTTAWKKKRGSKLSNIVGRDALHFSFAVPPPHFHLKMKSSTISLLERCWWGGERGLS